MTNHLWRPLLGGREWAGAIDAALRSADIVLLLISADFLASDYCNDVELTEAIRRHDATQTRVVPVILRSCDWEHSRFARFNALPPDGVPVVEAEHPDQRFVAVAKGLRAIVAELMSPDSATSTPNPTRSDASPATSSTPGAEAPSAGAGARNAPSARDAAAPAPTPQRLTIGKISLFGFELGGPFDIPLPQLGAKPLLLGLGILVLLIVLLGGGVYVFALSSPLAKARDAMRMACYDTALDALDTVPAWLRIWPAWVALRAKAGLGARTYRGMVPRQDAQRAPAKKRRQPRFKVCSDLNTIGGIHTVGNLRAAGPDQGPVVGLPQGRAQPDAS